MSPQVPAISSASTVSTLVVRRIYVPKSPSQASVVRGQHLPQIAPQALELSHAPRVSHQLSPAIDHLKVLVIDVLPRFRSAAIAHAPAETASLPCKSTMSAGASFALEPAATAGHDMSSSIHHKHEEGLTSLYTPPTQVLVTRVRRVTEMSLAPPKWRSHASACLSGCVPCRPGIPYPWP